MLGNNIYDALQKAVNPLQVISGSMIC